MTPAELLTALVLLVSPVGTPVDPASLNADLVRTVAVAWEILDPREASYTLTQPNELQANMDLLRQRRLDLADAPPAADACRFPERAVVNDWLALNRAHKAWLEHRQAADPARYWYYRRIIDETDHLYRVWDLTREARCEYYYVTVRRLSLLRLRDLLGEDAYYRGELPPWLPVWRFGEAGPPPTRLRPGAPPWEVLR